MKAIAPSGHADLIEHLSKLEYAIRLSMIVREDQDEPANPEHKDEAQRYGVSLDNEVTKGDLLNAVQTLVRAKQKESIQDGTRNQSA